MEWRTRNEALEKGDLIDVSAHAAAIGFTVPVALTREAWEELIDIKYDISLMDRNPRMRERRLLDILLLAMRAARASKDGSIAQFNLYRLASPREKKATGKVAIRNDVIVCSGPGDMNEHVVTISLWHGRSNRKK